METTFAEGVARWRDFYALAGSAAAGLVGLLFVSVSLHLETIVRSGRGAVRVLSEQTLTSFIYVLLIALFFMVPAQNPAGLGLPLLVMGLFGCWRTLQTFMGFRRSADEPGRVLRSGYVWRRFAYPAVSHLGLTLVSLLTLRGHPRALGWVLVVTLFLLVSATLSSWDLMLLLAAAKHQDVDPAERSER